MRHFFLLAFVVLFPLSLFAQQNSEGSNAPLNQIDKKGRREGMWLVQQPERMGEDAYTEFGNYAVGRKVGTWYRMDNMGEVKAIEHYKNDVLDGEAKYFEQGRLVTIGHYRGLNPARAYDTILVVHPVTGFEKLTAIPTERGTVRHGIWQFYDPLTGRLIREDDYQADELMYHQEFTIANTDSVYYEQRNKNLPHNRKHYYKPPAGKSSRIDR